MSEFELTPRQSQILRLIQDTLQETGMPPTRKEIADELGFKSPNAAEEHLRVLDRLTVGQPRHPREHLARRGLEGEREVRDLHGVERRGRRDTRVAPHGA